MKNTVEKTTVEKDATKIQHDNRGLSLRVYFYGDVQGKAPTPVVPKVFWCGGRIEVIRNTVHGIEPLHSLPFNHATDLLWKINCLLRDHGIEVLHPRTVRVARTLAAEGVEIAK
jgi:hypothetical protein